jgi:hypothetical protein
LNHLTAEDAAAAPDVALGEFLVDSVLANILFDTGAQFLYLSTKFVKKGRYQLSLDQGLS